MWKGAVVNSFVKLNSITRRGGKRFQIKFDHSFVSYSTRVLTRVLPTTTTTTTTTTPYSIQLISLHYSAPLSNSRQGKNGADISCVDSSYSYVININ